MYILEIERKKLNLNQTEMAAKLGISKSYYSMLLHGYPISKGVAIKAFINLGIPLHVLLPNAFTVTAGTGGNTSVGISDGGTGGDVILSETKTE